MFATNVASSKIVGAITEPSAISIAFDVFRHVGCEGISGDGSEMATGRMLVWKRVDIVVAAAAFVRQS